MMLAMMPDLMPALLLTPPWGDLPESLTTLSSFAAQMQAVIEVALRHPAWSIGIVVLGIGLLQIVLDLFKRTLKATLTFVLKLPLSLSQWIWKRATAPTPTAKENQIDQLIQRLDNLRQEQDQAMAELKTLLAESAASPGTETKFGPESPTLPPSPAKPPASPAKSAQ